ncbi:hypothetical protein I4U23_002505 [Adineta vaga]|nr:hypothetical protein I4U23_002505 [Adineta vaga]
MLEMIHQIQIGKRSIRNLLIIYIDKTTCTLFFCFFRILLAYGDKGEIVLRGKGSGGLSEMKRKLHDNQIYVGVVRVRAVDEYGSHRAKFVYINYVGANVPTLRAARASTQRSDFERFFHGYHIQIYANTLEEISEDTIIDLLQACAGAHKPQAYEFS